MEKEKGCCTVTNTEIVFPHWTNHIDTIFGGKLVELMDITGALSAMRFAEDNVVTASIDALDFKMPVKQGDILELQGRVIHAGKTSMVVSVEVWSEPMFGRQKRFCCHGFFIYVAINEEGRPKRIPKLSVTTDKDREFWELGKSIRKRALHRG